MYTSTPLMQMHKVLQRGNSLQQQLILKGQALQSGLMAAYISEDMVIEKSVTQMLVYSVPEVMRVSHLAWHRKGARFPKVLLCTCQTQADIGHCKAPNCPHVNEAGAWYCHLSLHALWQSNNFQVPDAWASIASKDHNIIHI